MLVVVTFLVVYEMARRMRNMSASQVVVVNRSNPVVISFRCSRTRWIGFTDLGAD